MRSDKKRGKDERKNFDVDAHPESQYSHKDLEEIEGKIKAVETVLASEALLKNIQDASDLIAKLQQNLNPESLERLKILNNTNIEIFKSSGLSKIDLGRLKTHLQVAENNSDPNQKKRAGDLKALLDKIQLSFQKVVEITDQIFQYTFFCQHQHKESS